MKKRALVVCPGRGTYTKETLGYLQQNGQHIGDFLADIDHRRRALDQPTISALDGAEVFKPQIHTKGENASSLIYACAYADFMAINRDKYEIVAVTGNSMGWYLTLAFAGSLNWASGFEVINTMGSMMKDEIIGGQIIYPISDENWRPSIERMRLVESAIKDIGSRPGHLVYISIYLGGYIVLGANRAGAAALLKELPSVENYPFQLINHAAFHTPLLQETSEKAFSRLAVGLFTKPQLPMIDGQGNIWQPYSTSIPALYNYTLGHQVVAAYDFTTAISVGLKEFCPDNIILLGPGGSLGGALGQILIKNDWFEFKNKSDFTDRQASNPFILSMGRPDQRTLVI